MARLEAVIGSALAGVLEGGRDRYNAWFVQARRDFPRLDGDLVLEFLRQRVDPIATAVAQHDPQAVGPALDVLFDAALEMFGRGLIGSLARHAELEELWSRLMLGIASALAKAPSDLVRPLTNALFHLLSTPRCRAAAWCELLRQVARCCDDPQQLLAAGRIAAWVCGMAHLREAALRLAAELPSDLVRPLFDPAAAAGLSLAALLERLRSDPWYHPSTRPEVTSPRIVAEVGGFRGLGGEFLRPPDVACESGDLFVADGNGCWQILADAFGVVFRRVGRELPHPASPGRYTLSRQGTVRGPAREATLPLLAGANSSASNDHTLAVTLPHSHRVFLVTEGGT